MMKRVPSDFFLPLRKLDPVGVVLLRPRLARRLGLLLCLAPSVSVLVFHRRALVWCAVTFLEVVGLGDFGSRHPRGGHDYVQERTCPQSRLLGTQCLS